jgi:hypothetical protein
VQFVDGGGTPLGPPVTLSSGKATLVLAANAGHYTVRADYSGDANFSTSSTSVGHTVNRAETSTSITSDHNPAAGGDDVTFTVFVNTTPPGGLRPTGPIAILADGQDVSGPIPLFPAGPTSAGVAVTFTAPQGPRSDDIGAVYRGDANTNPSSAPTFVQTITGPATATGSTGTGTAPAPIAPPIAPPATNPVVPMGPGATTAQELRTMTASLVRALKRSGLTALTRTTETLATHGPGKLTQFVYTPAAPKTALASRNVLVASSSKTFKGAGTGKVKPRPTAAGRRLMRQTNRLRLAIVTRFAPPTGTPVVILDRLTAKYRTLPMKATRSAVAPHEWRITQPPRP